MDWPFGDLRPLKYGAILADPPWSTAMRSQKGYAKSPERHYDTMSAAAIKALPVSHLAGADCYLFLWAVWPQLPLALEVLNAWGFSYVTGGSWLKRTVNWRVSMGTGYVLRSATEPFLVGKVGAPQIGSRGERNAVLAPQTLEPDQLPDSIEAVRREHSRKPPEMRALIERLLPNQFCCELFGREPWSGHDVWGNETARFEGVP